MFYYKKMISVPDFDFVREDKDKKIDFSSGKTKDNEHLSNFNSNLFAEAGQLLGEKKRNFILFLFFYLRNGRL